MKNGHFYVLGQASLSILDIKSRTSLAYGAVVDLIATLWGVGTYSLYIPSFDQKTTVKKAKTHAIGREKANV